MSHDTEELQLLRQVLPCPVKVTHSATRAIAQRLADGGDAIVIDFGDAGAWLEFTTQGRKRLLDAAGPVERCPFCGALPVRGPGGTMLMHPLGASCILADFATSNVDGWNSRA